MNTLTKANQEQGREYVTITSDGRSHASTHITLSTGQSLGLVQGVTWSFVLGDGGARCTITSIANPAELRALAKDTILIAKPHPDSLKEALQWVWFWLKATLSR